jgi:hypothetical protein
LLPSTKKSLLPRVFPNKIFSDYLTPLKAAANIKTLIPIFQIFFEKFLPFFSSVSYNLFQELIPVFGIANVEIVF